MSWNNALDSKKPSNGYSHNYDAANNALLKERVVTLEKQVEAVIEALSEQVLVVDRAEKTVQIVIERLDQQAEVMALLLAELEAK